MRRKNSRKKIPPKKIIKKFQNKISKKKNSKQKLKKNPKRKLKKNPTSQNAGVKIILAGGKIILAGGKIILAGWKIILVGLITTRQSHPVRARKARKFLNTKKESEEKSYS